MKCFDDIDVCRVAASDEAADVNLGTFANACGEGKVERVNIFKAGNGKKMVTIDEIGARVPDHGAVHQAYTLMKSAEEEVQMRKEKFIALPDDVDLKRWERALGELNVARVKACKAEEYFKKEWYISKGKIKRGESCE